MSNTKAEPGYFDGMERAAPDEPVFPLRAKDPLAAPLVSEWASRRRNAVQQQHAAGEIDDAKRTLELLQCREADEIAFAMAEWRKGEEAAPVDQPTKGKPTYSGHAKTEEEIAAKALYDLTTETVARLDNATALASDAMGAKLPDWDEAITVLNYASSLIKAVADHIRPKRRSYAVDDEPPGKFDAAALIGDVDEERAELIDLLDEVVRDDEAALEQLAAEFPEMMSGEAVAKTATRKAALSRIKGEWRNEGDTHRL